MEKAEVDRWLRSYVEAWKSSDRNQIGRLFAEDVEYRYRPYDEPLLGREAVIRAWLGDEGHPGASARDDDATFDADYQTISVDGDVAVATGRSTYLSGPGGTVVNVYDNCFVMRFDVGGRCRSFTEWYRAAVIAGFR
jgi:ketosteroid isomerase-like protein